MDHNPEQSTLDLHGHHRSPSQDADADTDDDGEEEQIGAGLTEDVDHGQHHDPEYQPGTSTPSPAMAPAQTPKRKPGRPKGSTTKVRDPNAVHLKRPVGRPRKDGMPAGWGKQRPIASMPLAYASSPTPVTSTTTPYFGTYNLAYGSTTPTIFSSPPQPTSYSSISNAIFPTPRPAAPSTSTSAPINSPSTSSKPPPTNTSPRVEPARPPASEPPPKFSDIPILDDSDIGSRIPTDPLAPAEPPPLSEPEAKLSSLKTIVHALSEYRGTYTEGLYDSTVLADAFKAQLNSLQANPSNPAIPTVYSLMKTFWMPHSPVYFGNIGTSQNQRVQPPHLFFFWDPFPLVFNGIFCPMCSNALENRGPIRNHPLKIFDVGEPIFIVGCEYLCRNTRCPSAPNGGTVGPIWASWDPSILRTLPDMLVDQFPAKIIPEEGLPEGGDPYLVGRGVTLTLWTQITHCMDIGIEKETALAIVTHGWDMAAPGWVKPYFDSEEKSDQLQPPFMRWTPKPTLKRQRPSDGASPGPSSSEKEKMRRVRHCPKCGSADCNGRNGRDNCTNPCRDCGSLACKGRNSQRPHKTCAEAWK